MSRRARGEQFARIPLSVLESEACKSLPHAAFKVLTILVVGNPEERNGTLALTDSYAKRFGITSRETRHRCLQELTERGFIVCTRQGMKMRKLPSLWAVTWWPIFNLEGQPLNPPKDPTHAYLRWCPKNSHTDGRCEVTPVVGVKSPPFHTDLPPKGDSFHTDGRWNSRSGYGANGADHAAQRTEADGKASE